MINLRGAEIIEIGHELDSTMFWAKTDRGILTVKELEPNDITPVNKAVKTCTDYTRKRYKSPIWNPLSCPVLNKYQRGKTGWLYMLMMMQGQVVGFSQHLYWNLTPKTKIIPMPVGSRIVTAELCVVDKFQGRGIGTIYPKISEYIAKYNGASFMIGETHLVRGMTNIRARQGWVELERRTDARGDVRVTIGGKLS